MVPFFLALYNGSQVSIVALWATCLLMIYKSLSESKAKPERVGEIYSESHGEFNEIAI